jgi:hypothetical protein
VSNPTPQKKKQPHQTNSSIVRFNHLNKLNFDDAHDDYIEQFLFVTKTCVGFHFFFLFFVFDVI